MEIKRIDNLEYLDTIVSFQLQMAKETEDLLLDEATARSGISAIIKDETKGFYYGAFIDQKLVACLMTTFEWSDWRNKTCLWIQSVFVDKEFRKQGIYKKMYHHLQEMVKNDNTYSGMRLYVDKTNTNAIDTYESLGMSKEHYHLYEWLKE